MKGLKSEMENNFAGKILKQNSFETYRIKPTYNPDLAYSEDFELSSVFDCREQMNGYSGATDYHSLMHNVQKPMLASNKVEELSFFANKLLLREWIDGLVPVQKIFGSSSLLNDESEIQRLFKIVICKVKKHEEFIIKPTNGSESIGMLKVYQRYGKLQSQFLCKDKEYCENINGDRVITDYKTFKAWIEKFILGVTCGNIDTHLRHIKSGLIIQEMFPHDKNEIGPTEMKYMTAWGELLFVGCRNGKDVCLGSDGDFLEGDHEFARFLFDKFFQPLKKNALSLAKASTFPNLRCDFFVDIKSGRWVLNEIETLADCRSYSDNLLKNTGEFYSKGWHYKKYRSFDSSLSVSVLRDRLRNELNIHKI